MLRGSVSSVVRWHIFLDTVALLAFTLLDDE
jgi:hypothetical protein